MKPELHLALQCTACGGSLSDNFTPSALVCTVCGQAVPVQDGIPLFTPPPQIVPSEKIARSPDSGTPWRQANWRFLKQQVDRLDPQSLILDVGAGRGDFADLFQERPYLALDVYPYPEVDLVCDLTASNPFRPGSLDAILLLNVMEHVYDTHTLLGSLAALLKPGGVIIVAIPFLVKIHQAPVDYVRYTHYALRRLGEDHGLQVETLEGYYDPLFFLGEGIGNLRWGVLPAMQGLRRYLGRLLLAGIQSLAGLLKRTVDAGQSISPENVRSSAPTGYQIVYRKVEE